MASRMLPSFSRWVLELDPQDPSLRAAGSAHRADSSCPRGPWPWGVWTWSELKWQSWEGGQDFGVCRVFSIQDWKLQTPDWCPLPHFQLRFPTKVGVRRAAGCVSEASSTPYCRGCDLGEVAELPGPVSSVKEGQCPLLLGVERLEWVTGLALAGCLAGGRSWQRKGSAPGGREQGPGLRLGKLCLQHPHPPRRRETRHPLARWVPRLFLRPSRPPPVLSTASSTGAYFEGS